MTDTAIGWPLDSNVIRRNKLNNTFGMVRRNADGTTRPHQGWDFYAKPGTPCYAVADGKIAEIRTVGDYGNTMVLAFVHDDMKLFAAYSHMSRMDFKKGDLVKKGQIIGLSGNTGNAVSMKGLDCHLHFELRTAPLPGRGLAGRISPLHIFWQCPLDEPILRVK